MGRALILFLLAVLVAPAAALADAGAASGPSAQIYYGHEAQAGQHPYQAYVKTSVGSCGGVLVGSRQVLTAGHCVSSLDVTVPGNVTVKLGSRDLSTATSYAVAQVERNAGFSSRTLHNDTTMLTLESPVPYAVLPLVPVDQPGLWAPGVTAQVSGWGQREDASFPDRLYEASIPIRSDSACQADYGKDYDPSTMLCAGGGTSSAPGADTCSGDSGGPLAVSGGAGLVLAGLTSWGGVCGSSFGVFTRLGAPTLNAWVNARIPHADFTSSPASPRAGEPVSFSGTATPPQGGVSLDTFRWDFDGDGQFDDGTGATASWIFPSAGGHQVGLEATASTGDRAVAVHTLAVTPSPDSGGRANTPAPRAAADQVAPLLRVGLPGTRRLLRALRRGIPVEVSCSELCRLTVTIRLAPRMARRLGVRVLVAQRAETLEASLRRTLRLAFGRRLAARLAPLSKLRLRVGVSATDSAGNRATVGRTLALRRR